MVLTRCKCGRPAYDYNLSLPCCSARMADAMHRSRPSLAFWWIATTKPPMDKADLERFRALYRNRRNVAKIT